MQAVTEFNRPNLRVLREKLGTLLEELGAEINVHFEVGNISFTTETAKITLDSTVSKSGVVETVAEKAFKTRCGYYGLAQSDLGRTFKYQGQEYQISGLKPSAPKYPVLAKRSFDGKEFRFPADMIKRLI